MSVGVIFDPRGHTWNSWASLMCELYAANSLAIPTDESEWRGWANGLKAIDVFTNNGVPDSNGYENWEDWAQALVGAINESPLV
tara:strand:+ start:5526 stop:5777 length:252 start_codon:yes stop_codon:yes gene_type:complete